MKKLFAVLAILPILALSIVSVASAQVNKPTISNMKQLAASNAKNEGMPLSCQVLFTFVKWGIQHPNHYLAIADFNKDKMVSAIDFSIFARNRNNNTWCSKQLGW